MNKHCAIIRDLAPLYAEKLTSAQTNEFIEEHLKICSSCRREIAELAQPTPIPAEADDAPLRKINRYLLRRRTLSVIATALVMVILFVLTFALLTTPEYLPLQQAMINVNGSTEGGKIQAVFSEQAADYHLDGPYEQDGIEVYCITAWTTPWHQIFSHTRHNLTLSITYDGNITPGVFYQNAPDQAPVQVFGSPAEAPPAAEAKSTLLNICALTAAGLVIVIALAYPALRKNHGRLWYHLLLIPASYLLSHFSILWLSPATYSIARNICLILLLTLALYGAIIFITALARKTTR